MRILLVDDHTLFRDGLAGLLKSQPDFTIVGEAGSAAEAIEMAHKLRPDLILMDIGLPDGSGIDAARTILAGPLKVSIVFLTMHEEEETLFEGIGVGARGYLLKTMPAARLLALVRGVEHGEPAIAPSMTDRILGEFSRLKSSHVPQPDHLDKLTAREIEVLQQIATSADNNEIAHRLTISEGTVKLHVHNILTKLGLRRRQELVPLVRAHHLAHSPDDSTGPASPHSP